MQVPVLNPLLDNPDVAVVLRTEVPVSQKAIGKEHPSRGSK